jgi:hypothetical protein
MRLAEQPWAGQLAVALGHIGLPVDLGDPQPISLRPLQQRALAHHLGEVQAAAARPGATKMAHHVGTVLGGRLPAPEEYAPAAFIGAVRQRARRAALAQLRTGSQVCATGAVNLTLRCGVCKLGMKGAAAGLAHAKETGETDIAEFSNILALDTTFCFVSSALPKAHLRKCTEHQSSYWIFKPTRKRLGDHAASSPSRCFWKANIHTL